MPFHTLSSRDLTRDVAAAKRAAAEAIAPLCASLHVPTPQSERDALIAAAALAHRSTMVKQAIQQ